MKMGKRKLVRIVSFVLAVVVSLAVWGAVTTVKLNKANMSIRQSNERALTQLGTYLDDITLNLQKSMYVSGKSLLSEITSDLWRSSVAAKDSLSEITDSDTELSAVYKFLSQVGEYTLSVNKRVSSGGKPTNEDSENLEMLLRYSNELSSTVNYLIEQEERGLLDFEQIESTLATGENENVQLGTQLNDANQSLSDYPTLIYDGPFSDHIMTKSSVLLKNKDEITQEKALEIAADFINVPTEKLSLLHHTHGNMPTYTFFSDSHTVSVTKSGGYVNYMLSSSYAGEIKLSYDEAIKTATSFLNEKGYDNMRETYYSTVDGICTVNFAYYVNGITHYPDLIKVSVALDDGRITAFDSTGYIMNHVERSIPAEVLYSPPEAKRFISDNLTVVSYKKAFIPTEWETEEYAYEFHCVDKNKQEVLVYVDPMTGDETDVLLLLYADGGVLTK